MNRASIRISFLTLFFLAAQAYSQATDSTATVETLVIVDPAQNRLFMMSTGMTMPAQRFSIGDFEVYLLQLGYAPTDFMHFNFSSILPLGGGESPYWSLGTKVQLLKESGGFKGLAVGADVGFFDELFGVSSCYESRLVSLNAAVSGGGNDANVHVNLAYLLPLTAQAGNEVTFPTYFQIGVDIALKHHNDGGGLKFIAELMSSFSRRGINGGVALVGIRVCGKKSALDFGWPFGIGTGGVGAAPIPFGSMTFFI